MKREFLFILVIGGFFLVSMLLFMRGTKNDQTLKSHEDISLLRSNVEASVERLQDIIGKLELKQKQPEQPQQQQQQQQQQQPKEPGPPMKFYSQQEEDTTIYNKYFKNKKNGVFVELGALDGVTYSNSKFFEESLGWRGVLIEPIPAKFDALKVNRPLANVFHLAICQDQTEVEMLGESATAGMVKTMSERFRKAWHGDRQDTYKVQCAPLSWVLKVSGVKKIDLFSLDVEGGELEVMNTMDWTIPIHVVVVELDEHNKEKDDKCRDILRENGFKFVQKLGGNDIWENPNYKEE